MAGIFKAYDVRGLYPDELDEEIAHKVGRAFRSILDPSFYGERRPSVVVGRDMRPHSRPLAAALTRGLLESGCDVVHIGLSTTPMSYFAVGHLEAAGGIQVTASHNPANYNGFKFSLDGARPVSGDDGIPRIERAVAEDTAKIVADSVAADGAKAREIEITTAYGDHLLSCLDRPANARRLKVAVDAANGMGTIYRPLLERAGIELLPLYFKLDGSFPNHEANPLKLENLEDLVKAVKQNDADLGVAFDGDADRAVFVDNLGEPIGSDLITALIGGRKLDLMIEGGGARSSRGRAVVYDVRSSRAVPEYILEHGGEPIRERVGHSFIKATMRQHDALFAGELAGHYYFRENYFADCSLLAVFEVLNILWRKRKPLSEIMAPLRRYAKSPEINFEVADPQAVLRQLIDRYGADGEIDEIDGIRIDFADWWFNVRPSNTEPLVRLVLEARDPAMLEKRQAELIEILGEPV